MNDNDDVRRPFVFLAVVVLGLGLGVFALSWYASAPVMSIELVCLLLAALISENYTVDTPGYTISLSYPLTLATLVLCGPTAALIVAGFSSTNVRDIRLYAWEVSAYNTGQILLSTWFAGWAYGILGGRVLLASGMPFGRADFPQMLLPLLASVFAMSLANFAFACLGLAVRNGQSITSVLESVGWLPWGQVALGLVGFMMAQVMSLNVAAFVFLIFPLLVARQFYQRYISLQSAYTDTIRSLIGALEAKDPYTRGHSERVAEYAVVLGQACGLDDRELSELEQAALLHDLGKLALPGSLLRKQDKLTDEEWGFIREHPSVGADMVKRIPPLRKLGNAVLCHHERLDGSGYPGRLTGEDLPIAARILAIADSYDAMTSDRPYRPGLSTDAAIAELERCAPGQLDGALVAKFIFRIPETIGRPDTPAATNAVNGRGVA